MSVTIAAFTSRKDPCFQWFADALCNQTTPEERASLQVILVDRHLWFPGLFRGAKEHTEWIRLTDPKYHDPSRRQYGEDCVRGRFPFLHLPPKPNVYCGPWRLTSKDWFCASNARNTAMIFANNPYFVGIDDLAVPLPGWFNQVKHAAENKYCVCGAYKKVKDLSVDSGVVTGYTPFESGVDSRWPHGSDGGIVKWSGAGLFGCSFGMPLNLAVRIDGFAPECNAMGAEDYDFGIRAERAGGEFFYNRNMVTLESEERHHLDSTLPRESRTVTNRLFTPAGYDAYRHSDPTKKFDSDHLLLNRVRNETSRILPIVPENIAKQRDRLASDGMINVPREPEFSWIDLKPLKEL